MKIQPQMIWQIKNFKATTRRSSTEVCEATWSFPFRHWNMQSTWDIGAQGWRQRCHQCEVKSKQRWQCTHSITLCLWDFAKQSAEGKPTRQTSAHPFRKNFEHVGCASCDCIQKQPEIRTADLSSAQAACWVWGNIVSKRRKIAWERSALTKILKVWNIKELFQKAVQTKEIKMH